MDVGARVILEAAQCKADVIARTITNGGEIISRGNLTGLHPDVKGHLECRGLLLGTTAGFLRVPELDGAVPGVDNVARSGCRKNRRGGEITYLMTRGSAKTMPPLPSFAASWTSRSKGVPPALQEEMRRAVHTTEGMGL